MNNVLPSSVPLHEKYDLKGSTYKRKASRAEKLKKKPTLKDLDFKDLHVEGLSLSAETYHALIRTIDRDCRVSFLIVACNFNSVLLNGVILIMIYSMIHQLGRILSAVSRSCICSLLIL